jgi:hypothetical protein
MIAGGLIYRHFPGDSFTILKVLSMIVGMALILVMAHLAREDFRFQMCFILSCLSIALIDFSANGSFYIMCAFLYLAFFVSVLKGADSQKYRRWAVVAGLIGLAALMTHLISLALAVSATLLFLRGRGRLRTIGLISAATMCGAFVLYQWWRRATFDIPPNSSFVNFFVRNGLAAHTVDRENLRFVADYGVSLSSALVILRNLLSGVRHFVSDVFVLCGPMLLFLFAGVRRLISRRDKPALGVCLSILAGHVLVVVVFPFSRFRFMVPVAPLVFFVVSIGIEAFLEKRDSRLMSRVPLTRYQILTLLVALFVGYNLFYLARYPYTFYDKSRAGTVRAYGEMREAASWFRDNVECGTVLGYSRVLDGGVEAYYYHRCPFVAGRKFIPYPDLLPRLLEKYDIEYIWTEREVWNASDLLKELPIVHQHGRFLILSSSVSP